MAVVRGDTCSWVFKGIDTSKIEQLIIDFTQGGKIIHEKNLSDCEIVDNSIYTRLSQEETLALEPNKDMHIKLRFKLGDSDISSSQTINEYVEDTYNETII